MSSKIVNSTTKKEADRMDLWIIISIEDFRTKLCLFWHYYRSLLTSLVVKCLISSSSSNFLPSCCRPKLSPRKKTTLQTFPLSTSNFFLFFLRVRSLSLSEWENATSQVIFSEYYCVAMDTEGDGNYVAIQSQVNFTPNEIVKVSCSACTINT